MRFDPYGTALRHALYPAWERLRGRPTFPLLDELRNSERASADELVARRIGALRRLVRHAYAHTAHYRAAFDRAGVRDIRSLDDLAQLPILDRALARSTVDQRTAAWPAVAYTKTTSGSTGIPLEVRMSHESRNWRDAVKWRGFGWGGYQPGDKAMHLWGVAAQPPTGLRRAKIAIDRALRRDIYVNCMVRSPAILRTMVATLERERPTAILGYAQAIADLARFINSERLRSWDSISVIYGAERLWESDRAAIRDAFGPAVFETYGSREFMLLAAECEAHDGLHEQAENVIVEIVVDDGGRWRPARIGETGEVAVTDLHNLACPMIRYLIGDRATHRDQASCGCGRTLPRLGQIEGRVTETMRDGDGNLVEGLLFNIVFLEIAKHARQFQVVQRTSDRRVELRVVPYREALPADCERMVRDYVATHLRGVPFEIVVVDDIPLTAAGKLKRVTVE